MYHPDLVDQNVIPGMYPCLSMLANGHTSSTCHGSDLMPDSKCVDAMARMYHDAIGV